MLIKNKRSEYIKMKKIHVSVDEIYSFYRFSSRKWITTTTSAMSIRIICWCLRKKTWETEKNWFFQRILNFKESSLGI